MTRDDIKKEIRRIMEAIEKTGSEKLRRDYGKRLKRLEKELLYSEG